MLRGLAEARHRRSTPELSSLSAILLDDEYYEFVQEGTRVVDGLSVLAPEYVVPLASAWTATPGGTVQTKQN